MRDELAKKQPILAFDTSNRSLSVAVGLGDGRILGEINLELGLKHSVNFLPAVEDILHLTQLKLDEIQAFVCTTGPGSYTGIRIGIATAQAFAYSLNKPVLGINSLEALAYSGLTGQIQLGLDSTMERKPCWLLAAIDARGGRLYAAMYRILDNGDLKEAIEPRQFQAGELKDSLNELVPEQDTDIVLVGDGLKQARQQTGRQFLYREDPSANKIKAASLIPLAIQRNIFGQERGSDLPLVRAEYCALSQAERLRKDKK